MRRARIYVHPDFKYKLDRCKADLECRENRNINIIELTKSLDINVPFNLANRRDKLKNERKKISF